MPFNGSGTYSPPAADFPAVTATIISSSKYNNVVNDMATALTNCVTRDGQSPMTAALPMGGQAINNIAAGTVAAPSINFTGFSTTGWSAPSGAPTLSVAGIAALTVSTNRNVTIAAPASGAHQIEAVTGTNTAPSMIFRGATSADSALWRFGDTRSSGAGTVSAIEQLNSRVDGNTSFQGRFGASYWRQDGTAIANGAAIGMYAFGGMWGGSTTYLPAQHLYAASIVGVAEGSFTSATAMPTGLSFRTGSTGDLLIGANLTYGTERMRLSSAGLFSIIGNTATTGLNITDAIANVRGRLVWNGTFDIWNADNGSLRLGTNNNSNMLVIGTNGNVTINAPVSGDHLSLPGASATIRLAGTGTLASDSTVTYLRGTGISFQNAAATTTWASISSAGNVTINAPSSGYALTVNGPGGGGINVTTNNVGGFTGLNLNQSDTSGSSNVNINMVHGSGTNCNVNLTNSGAVLSSNTTLVVGTSAATNVVMRTNNVDRVTLSSAGNVTINAPSSGQSLFVSGVSTQQNMAQFESSRDALMNVVVFNSFGTGINRAAQVEASCAGSVVMVLRSEPGSGRGLVGTTSSHDAALIAGGGQRLIAQSTGTAVFPATDNATTMGANGVRWSAVWAVNGTIQTSDARDKDIEQIIAPELANAFVRSVARDGAALYRWIEGGRTPDQPDEPSKPVPGKRLHAGFLAQVVERTYKDLGLRDFGGHVVDADGKHHLRYDQMIPMLYTALANVLDRLEAIETHTLH